ncbi:MAG: protein translocase subunit SecD [Succinivibrionaceae bacterium]|nr:protein translocase subunit SecD [Succinivibrionaceae bacterium]MDY6336635.1 protein translocase subunit SecD [Succinivibrionaceae bacterium]MDY6374764.1 protein translocase subunit SecD [Succinivibrionaceae bacterium]
MINKFPLWKNLLVIAIVLFGIIYSIPNLFGEDPAIQINATKGASVTQGDADRVLAKIKELGITPKSSELKDDQFVVRFNSEEDEFKAREEAQELLGERFIVAMNLLPSTPKILSAIGAEPLKLGLDLRGGVHFLMEIDMDEALAKSSQQYVQDIKSELQKQKIHYSSVTLGDEQVITTAFRTEKERDDAIDYLRTHHNDLIFTSDADGQKFLIKARITENRLAELKTYAVDQNINIIRNRVNELGVAEPLVQRQGSDRIIVELPGIQDTARAKEILGATATLEFRMVDDAGDIESAAKGSVSANSEVFQNEEGRPVVLRKKVILTGDHIQDANAGVDEYGRPQVNIKLDGAGGNRMMDETRDNIGKPMATLFIEYKPTKEVGADGKHKFKKVSVVANVATIQSTLGSNFRITGIGNAKEARNLALILRAGALIAPIQIVEERTIGPSLGKQNIESGLHAMELGLALILVFMAIYYRWFGVIADLALIMNLFLLVGMMSIIPGAVMTLPGIAGIVLTLGMAVDANVLIFERIREELEQGRSPQQAIELGFGRAFITIMDSNLTSLITAAVLFCLGTGAVKGFAIVLMIGIASSLFTAITASRALVNVIWGGKAGLKTLPI